jgi:antitoxin VapB
MNLQIRDPRAREKAEKLARLQNTTMSEAVIDALDFRLKHVEKAEHRRSAMDVAAEIRASLLAKSKGLGPLMTKEDMDAMWGQ